MEKDHRSLLAFVGLFLFLSLSNSLGQTNNYQELIDLGSRYDYAHSVVIQKDGKVVVAGDAGSTPFLLRFDTLGGLDKGFGDEGKVFGSWSCGSSYAEGDLVIQADGRILLGTSYYNGSYMDYTVARYHPDGTPDVTFGSQGQVITSLSPFHDRCNALAIQSDGKIVAAGESKTEIGDASVMAVIRYTEQGVLDTTFGIQGVVETSIGLHMNIAHSIVIQKDQKILLAGEANDSIFSDIALARFTSDGMLDNTFGEAGVVRTALSDTYDDAKSVLIQADGKILAVGSAQNGLSNNNIALIRYLSNGSLDASFGEGGKVIRDLGNDFGNGLAIQQDQKIVLTGSTTPGTLYDFVTLRFLSDGSPDTTFGTMGVITTSFGSGSASGRAIALGADGEIVLAGSYNHGSPKYMDIAIARLHSKLPTSIAPSLSTPENGAEGLSIHPTMTWSPIEGALSYNLELSASPEFDSEVISATGLPSTRYSISGLEENSPYFWRVSSNSFAGRSDWSTIWFFVTGKYTGTSEPNSERMKLYPMPAGNRLFIEGFENLHIEIQLLSLDGKVVKASKGYGIRELDFSGLSKGFYILRAYCGSDCYTERIVKQ